MSDNAIKVENLSKLYQLGEIGSSTLSKDLNRWWAKIRGKEDPYTKVGQVNDRTKKLESNFVWALKDINFEVKEGEVLGIIGKNGAGKSTLLKILSRITSPTTGKIYTKGRIASLLEVGTGFHPEMTGRENIYLNGAILGMRKSEIDKKFDEIVDFAGIEAYIDTPVKRYSSGMYVRLAFAVAAFLEPETLIVDEVLAVGDAEFQKKCLGRMKEVSANHGRTIIFVSHDMSAIQKLTTKAIFLERGLLSFEGDTNIAINFYRRNLGQSLFNYNPQNKKTGIIGIDIVTSLPGNIHLYGMPLEFIFKCNFNSYLFNASLAFQLKNENGVSVINPLVVNDSVGWFNKGNCSINCYIPNPKLYFGKYYLTAHLGDKGSGLHIETIEDVCCFEVIMDNKYSEYGWKPNTCIYLEDVIWKY